MIPTCCDQKFDGACAISRQPKSSTRRKKARKKKKLSGHRQKKIRPADECWHSPLPLQSRLAGILTVRRLPVDVQVNVVAFPRDLVRGRRRDGVEQSVRWLEVQVSQRRRPVAPAPSAPAPAAAGDAVAEPPRLVAVRVPRASAVAVRRAHRRTRGRGATARVGSVVAAATEE